MPIGSAHRTQSTKNWLLLGLLVMLVASVYGIAMVRINASVSTAEAVE